MHCHECGAALVVRTVTEHGRRVERTVCGRDGCGFTLYGNPVPVVQCIVERDDGHVLLARNLEWPANMYGLVSGFLEGREQPHVGMARELEEEVGVRVDPEALQLVGVATYERLNQLLVLYHVRIGSDVHVEANPDELAGIKWVPIHRLKFPWKEGAGPLLRRWMMERVQSRL